MVKTSSMETAARRPSRRRSTEGFAPRYRVIEEPDGFRVEGRDRHPVFVRLSPGKTLLLVVGDLADLGRFDDESGEFDYSNGRGYSAYTCGLYGYHRLLELVGGIAMETWLLPPDPPSAWGGVTKWALERTRTALHFRGVYQQWQRMLALAPPEHRLVSKAVFAATFDGNRLGLEARPVLYQHRYLVEDILRYRAAASAVHYAENLVERLGAIVAERRGREGNSRLFVLGGVAERCEAYMARLAHLDPFEVGEPVFARERLALKREVLDILASDWKALYSSSGSAGRSLCRTLMNLPGGISGRLLTRFSSVEPLLRRPITDRLELLVLLEYASWNYYQGGLVSDAFWEGPIYAQVRRQDVQAGLRRLSAHLRRELRPKAEGVATLVNFVGDYCRHCRQEGLPAHRGTLVGLVDKAIRWHREELEEAVKRYLARFEDTTPTALPPVPLPDDPAVQFLAQVRDLHREGVEMGHCIASYADDALAGSCYLFHIERNGTAASTQVDRQGHVVQSYGPHNVINEASEYGRRVLGRWGREVARAVKAAGEGAHLPAASALVPLPNPFGDLDAFAALEGGPPF